LKILKIHAEENGGGANQIACALLRGYIGAGNQTRMAVRHRNSNWEAIYEVPNEKKRNIIYRQTKSLLNKNLQANIPIVPKVLSHFLPWTEPLREFQSSIGLEDFNYPGTEQIVTKAEMIPDVVHCHNLHSDFFDLKQLAKISLNFPTFITLHDCWMFTGHCVHPYECEQWKSQCIKCPYPDRPIATKRDACKWNQNRKKNIYQKSKFYVSAPSQWLNNMAKQSILGEGSVEFRHIPNGVNDEIFQIGDKNKLRKELGYASGEKIILFIGNAASKNPTKGFENLLKLLECLAKHSQNMQITFLVLGDTFEDQFFGENIKLKSMGWIHDREEIVKYYQISDIYLHLANAENFPTTILEAMHCGLPVIGSRVGGIPEQIVHGKTGYCFFNHQTNEIIDSLLGLIGNNTLLAKMGIACKERAMNLYTETRMLDSYLAWFEEILTKRKSTNLRN
tara:strand:+ start:791 stop:2140 length:1350 start_codon:yes stop_codon:yes gene_type:complete